MKLLFLFISCWNLRTFSVFLCLEQFSFFKYVTLPLLMLTVVYFSFPNYFVIIKIYYVWKRTFATNGSPCINTRCCEILYPFYWHEVNKAQTLLISVSLRTRLILQRITFLSRRINYRFVWSFVSYGLVSIPDIVIIITVVETILKYLINKDSKEFGLAQLTTYPRMFLLACVW